MANIKEIEIFGKHAPVLRIYDKLFPLYIVKGEKNFLIDSGVTARAELFHERIEKALKETGPSGNQRQRIDTLLLTHTHWDHTGAAYYLQQIYGFNVMASRRGVELLQKQKVVGFIDRLNRDYKTMLQEVSDVRFDRLDKLEAVSGGDTIRVDAENYFEVIETPGHTKCAVSYLLRPDNVLFMGDSAGLLEKDGAIKPIFLSSYSEYEDSLRKLMSLEVEAMAFPHNRFLAGKDKVKKYLRDSFARTQEVKEEILKILKDEKDTAKIAETLYRQEFPITSIMGPKEAMMINLEAMVKAVAHEVRNDRGSFYSTL
ncbi:MAG: MBL fold metallo-hydrolase [Candidatus Aminicenantes bacterium]|nr:MBL fold metallo-hydrolase [Candidatus Aminicenantes bacterium]